MDAHTSRVVLIAKAIVTALKDLDIAVDVAAVLKSVTVECHTVGVFNVKLESHAAIDDARFEAELIKFLTGDTDGVDNHIPAEPNITGGDIS